MRILLISNGFPPKQWAGTETYTAGIALELAKRGHEVHVLCGGDWDHGAHYWNGYTDEEYQGIPVRRLHLNWMKAPDPFLYLFDNPVTAAFLANYLVDVQPDLVHVTSCERLSASVLRTVKNAAVPLVLSLTDFWFLCPRINLLRSDGTNCDGQTTPLECLTCQMRNTKFHRWSQRLLPGNFADRLLLGASRYPQLTRQRGLRGMAGDMAARKTYLRAAISWPDHRITASDFVRALFAANDVTLPIHVQPYGHDLGWLTSYSGKRPSEKLRFGFIGQIVHSKGPHILLQAMQNLRTKIGDRITLAVYGDLEKVPEYAAQLRALGEGLGNVEFRGTYSHDQSADVFAELDVLVVPSLWYDFPLIIWEAFATHTIVIASNLGGMAEAVRHDVSGLLFERGNAEELAGQMSRLVEEPELLPRLQAQIEPTKTIGEEMTELEGLYMKLCACNERAVS